MGQERNKLARGEGRAQLIRLRRQIEVKREEISGELAILKARQAATVLRAGRVGKLVGITAIGILCLGSLTNAVVDLFRPEDSEPSQTQTTITEALAGFALLGLRIAAGQFIKSQISTLRVKRLRTGAL